jgi:6,7-dimethyl-8-ribityllumazine synthase
MAEACDGVLRQAGYSDIQQHTLPGSLEIPLAARDLLAEDTAREIDAVICFGVIVKGDTLHFEMISEESMRGLGQVMHEFCRPVLVEILPVFDIQQAIDRCSDDEFNKGIEAAVAAIEMIHWRRGVTGAN